MLQREGKKLLLSSVKMAHSGVTDYKFIGNY